MIVVVVVIVVIMIAMMICLMIVGMPGCLFCTAAVIFNVYVFCAGFLFHAIEIKLDNVVLGFVPKVTRYSVQQGYMY